MRIHPIAGSKFQRSEKLNAGSARPVAWLFAGLLLAVPSPASANEASATAAFPLMAAYGPTLAPAATSTAAYAPTIAYTAAAVPANPGPSPTAPAPLSSSPAAPVVPQDTPATAPLNQAPGNSSPAADRRDLDEKKRDRKLEAWLLALEGYTTAPVDIGGRVTFETPFRLRLSGAYGIVPGAYFGLVNQAVEGSGAYDSFGADSVEASLDDGHVWRAMVGFRPIGGLYLDAGYAQIALAGGLQADQFAYSIDTKLHMWTAEIGFQGAVADHLLIALGVGVMKTFAADSTVAANFEFGNSNVSRNFTDDAVREYDSKLEQYGIVPTVSLRIGWDFF